MKMIFENWKRYLEEGANLDYDRYAFYIEKPLNDGDYILTLFDVKVLEEIVIRIYKIAKKEPDYNRKYFLLNNEEFFIKHIDKCLRGMVVIDSLKVGSLPCYQEKGKKGYNILFSAAVDKLGPMIYDFALQMVKFKGGVGLMADRGSVSKSASSVWQRYLDSGRGATGIEVKSARLDYEPPDNTTDTERDDCQILGRGQKRSKKDLEMGINHIFYVDSISSEFNSMGLRGQQTIKEYKKGKIINIDGKDIKLPSIGDIKGYFDEESFFKKHYRSGAVGFGMKENKRKKKKQ